MVNYEGLYQFVFESAYLRHAEMYPIDIPHTICAGLLRVCPFGAIYRRLLMIVICSLFSMSLMFSGWLCSTSSGTLEVLHFRTLLHFGKASVIALHSTTALLLQFSLLEAVEKSVLFCIRASGTDSKRCEVPEAGSYRLLPIATLLRVAYRS